MLTRFRNLNIRFVGEDGEGGGDDGSTEVDATTAPPESDMWGDFRSTLDPISFSRIEPHLKDMERSANERIAKSGQQYAPYKPFMDAGISPEDLSAGMTLAQQVNTDPAALYTALGDFLEREGRLPTKKELQQEVAEPEGVDPNAAEAAVEDPRIAQLMAQQDQINSFLSNQQRATMEANADEEVTTEINALKSAHPELEQDDINEIISRAAFVAQSTGKIPTLDSVHDGWYQGLRSRFLSTPRPGAAAPKLIPTSGGLPSNIPQKSLGELSNAEVQDTIAAMIEANR